MSKKLDLDIQFHPKSKHVEDREERKIREYAERFSRMESEEPKKKRSIKKDGDVKLEISEKLDVSEKPEESSRPDSNQSERPSETATTSTEQSLPNAELITPKPSVKPAGRPGRPALVREASRLTELSLSSEDSDDERVQRMRKRMELKEMMRMGVKPDIKSPEIINKKRRRLDSENVVSDSEEEKPTKKQVFVVKRKYKRRDVEKAKETSDNRKAVVDREARLAARLSRIQSEHRAVNRNTRSSEMDGNSMDIEDTPKKRGPGRPPKIRTLEDPSVKKLRFEMTETSRTQRIQQTQNSQPIDDPMLISPAKRRGRPPNSTRSSPPLPLQNAAPLVKSHYSHLASSALQITRAEEASGIYRKTEGVSSADFTFLDSRNKDKLWWKNGSKVDLAGSAGWAQHPSKDDAVAKYQALQKVYEKAMRNQRKLVSPSKQTKHRRLPVAAEKLKAAPIEWANKLAIMFSVSDIPDLLKRQEPTVNHDSALDSAHESKSPRKVESSPRKHVFASSQNDQLVDFYSSTIINGAGEDVNKGTSEDFNNANSEYDSSKGDEYSMSPVLTETISDSSDSSAIGVNSS